MATYCFFKDGIDNKLHQDRLDSVHFQYTLLLGNFLFLYCNESVLFFLILNIQSGRFEFVKKFDSQIIIIEKNTIK
jgi:hypothetical protein